MPVIKATDLAYGRLRSPDLDKQEEFLTAFGMVRADRTKTALYMRGTDPPHHIHVTELGAPKYVGIALHAGSMDDLEKLARAPGASPIEIDRRAGRRQARAADRSRRLPGRGRPRHGAAAEDRGRAPAGQHRRRQDAPPQRALSRRARPQPRQAHRPLRRAFAAVREDARLVPRHARLPLLGRGLCRPQGQYRRLVQPARPRRRLCRPPRLLLHPQRQGRAQPPVLRGRRHRRHHDRPRASGRRRATSISGGSAAIRSAARCSIIGATRGAGCTSTGPTPTCSTPACRPICRAAANSAGRGARPPPERFMHHATP